MAKVQLANVAVLDNPSPFLNPFQFEVTFECIEELKEGNLYGYYYHQRAYYFSVIFSFLGRLEVMLVAQSNVIFIGYRSRVEDDLRGERRVGGV